MWLETTAVKILEIHRIFQTIEGWISFYTTALEPYLSFSCYSTYIPSKDLNLPNSEPS